MGVRHLKFLADFHLGVVVKHHLPASLLIESPISVVVVKELCQYLQRIIVEACGLLVYLREYRIYIRALESQVMLEECFEAAVETKFFFHVDATNITPKITNYNLQFQTI